MAPRMPLALTKLSRSLTSLKYHGARPRSISSGAENQRTIRTFSLLPREAPLNSRRPRIPSLPPHPAMAGLAQQPPQGIGPFAQYSPYIRYQLAIVPHPVSPTRANSQDAAAASPNDPSQLAPICIWVGEGAWRQSRKVGELQRGHVSFSLLLSPLPRATFPSYDLCFPALPKKEGGGTGRGGGPTIQAGYLEVGVGKEVRTAIGEHVLTAWQLMPRSQAWPPEVCAPSPLWSLVTSRVTSRLDSAKATHTAQGKRAEIKADGQSLQGASETPSGGPGNSTLRTSSDQANQGP